MKPLLLALPGVERLTQALAEACGVAWVAPECKRLPDGEIYVRVPDGTALRDRDAAIVASLFPPNDRAMAMLFTAALARDLGARRVGVICPYLGYLRQDRRKHPGEALTASYFAQLVSTCADWMVTLDPHLREPHGLEPLYSIPVQPCWSAGPVARWVMANVASPYLVGPDAGSRPQLERLSVESGLPFTLLEKVRKDERQVELRARSLDVKPGATAVVVDDILSTGSTMAAAVQTLRAAGFQDVVGIATHALFVEDAEARLRAAGCSRIATCNTVVHPTNAIDVVGTLAAASRAYLS